MAAEKSLPAPQTDRAQLSIPPQCRIALGDPEDSRCQSSPGMGLAQCWSMQDVCCCLLRHLPSEPMYTAVMLRLCYTLLIHVHWPSCIGLSIRVWTKVVQRPGFRLIGLQMQGPSTAYQPEADRIKLCRRIPATCWEAAQRVLLWGTGTHRTTHFLLGDIANSVLICPDLIKSCSAGRNPGWTWIWAPWHAVMGMATGLVLEMLLSRQQTQITHMHWWQVPTYALLWPCHPGTRGLLGPVWRQR